MLIAIAMVTSLSAAAAAEAPAVKSEDVPLIKAAIVYNICKFVTWPAPSASRPGFVVGVLGKSPGDPEFAAIAGKKLHGRPLRVVTVDEETDLSRCDVIFVSRAMIDQWPRVRAIAPGILSVSDFEGFGAAGGAVELSYDGRKVRFTINQVAAASQQLRLSSQLLKIATKIITNQ